MNLPSSFLRLDVPVTAVCPVPMKKELSSNVLAAGFDHLSHIFGTLTIFADKCLDFIEDYEGKGQRFVLAQSLADGFDHIIAAYVGDIEDRVEVRISTALMDGENIFGFTWQSASYKPSATWKLSSSSCQLYPFCSTSSRTFS